MIDLRAYYNASEFNDDWRPTQKGICISVELLPKLKEGIDNAVKEWKKKTQNRF